MLRFHCAGCKKLKHTRVMPVGLSRDDFDLIKTPKDRVGLCRRHAHLGKLLTHRRSA